MHQNLALALLDKKIIQPGKTRVDVDYVDVSCRKRTRKQGTFVIEQIHQEDPNLRFLLKEPFATNQIVVTSEQILKIDGMTPETVANAFDYKPDGTKKKLGKRRGRPRKHPLGTKL